MVVIPGSILDLESLPWRHGTAFYSRNGSPFLEEIYGGGGNIGNSIGRGGLFNKYASGRRDSSICAIAGMFVNLFMFVTVVLVDKPRITVYKKIETYRNEYRQKGY